MTVLQLQNLNLSTRKGDKEMEALVLVFQEQEVIQFEQGE